jgi:hypothetical protein
MYIILGSPKTLQDLNGLSHLSVGEMRKKTRIAVIDDEVFPKRNALLQHDYQIKEVGDLKDISAIENYPIILCDIKGVGTHFNSPYEGGHLIEEINKFYPNKVIIAYTGERFDPTYNRFFQIADRSIRKDAEDDEWINVLDDSLKIVNDPCEQWKKTRKSLLELNISTLNLVKIEDLYVRSILEEQDLISQNKLINTLAGDAKNIVLNLASSFIFSFITGR